MDFGSDGERSRIEAARLMGELAEPVFADPLSRLIKDDPSPAVVREAMSAAASGKYPAVIPEVISRLSDGTTKTAAREALIQYGEMAVKGLRSALADGRVSRDIRLYIPKTLSKIHAQAAMNALHGGLLDEDRAIRFEVILALKEMARRFDDLKIDRQIIESAIMSDAQLYFRRFVICFALFNDRKKSSQPPGLAPLPCARGKHGTGQRKGHVAAFPHLSWQGHSARLVGSESPRIHCNEPMPRNFSTICSRDT